jgi:pimeloyl-ACP methyl ester carboxylesterase
MLYQQDHETSHEIHARDIMPTWNHPPTGTSLAYDDRGNGPALVLIHAFPLCREMWQPQAESLSDTYRVLTPDVFGFGESGLPSGGWTVDSMADVLADWLTALAVDRPVIGGLSMGGYIALAFARRHPTRVRGMILADTRADADSAETKTNREKTITFVEQNSAVALIDQMIPKILSETTRNKRPEVGDRIRGMGSKQTVVGVTAALRALRDRPDSTAALVGFRFPVLVLVGSEDTLTPPALAEAMAQQLPDVTTETLWSAGHLANLEMPVEFTRAVQRWLFAIS